MLIVETIAKVRRLFRNEHRSIREIVAGAAPSRTEEQPALVKSHPERRPCPGIVLCTASSSRPARSA